MYCCASAASDATNTRSPIRTQMIVKICVQMGWVQVSVADGGEGHDEEAERPDDGRVLKRR